MGFSGCVGCFVRVSCSAEGVHCFEWMCEFGFFFGCNAIGLDSWVRVEGVVEGWGWLVTEVFEGGIWGDNEDDGVELGGGSLGCRVSS